jgi:hypothetical protein
MKYVIGIGGTGAKCVEALVHLCAAGLGPEKLSIFFVDPDKNNGNLNQTLALLGQYTKCRKLLQKEGFAEPLFRTDIQLCEGAEANWTVYEKDGTQLRNKLLYTPGLADADLIDVLYTSQELDMLLDVGFQAHPSIGAALMATPPAAKNPWLRFWADLQGAGRSQVFMFGSVFGGTGAAGLPTLSTIIGKDPRVRAGNGNLLRMGATLLLPYFTATPAPGGTQISTYSLDGYGLAAKAALLYYAEKDNLGFDDLYLVGAPHLHKVGDQCKGGGDQRNAAHPVELVAALAARDFFGADAAAGRSYFMASKGPQGMHDIRWDNLPLTRTEGHPEGTAKVKLLLSAFTTFAYEFVYYVHPTARGDFDARTREHNQPWYGDNFVQKRMVGRNKDTFRESARNLEESDSIGQYCEKYLLWLRALSLEPTFKLVNAEEMKRLASDDPEAPPALLPLGMGGFSPRSAGLLLNHSSADAPALNETLYPPANDSVTPFSRFRDAMNEAGRKGSPLSRSNLAGASKIACLAYEGAHAFTRYNYGLHA